jgi:hypothetical protein
MVDRCRVLPIGASMELADLAMEIAGEESAGIKSKVTIFHVMHTT